VPVVIWCWRTWSKRKRIMWNMLWSLTNKYPSLVYLDIPFNQLVQSLPQCDSDTVMYHMTLLIRRADVEQLLEHWPSSSRPTPDWTKSQIPVRRKNVASLSADRSYWIYYHWFISDFVDWTMHRDRVRFMRLVWGSPGPRQTPVRCKQESKYCFYWHSHVFAYHRCRPLHKRIS
jgi:hypothetical protein